MFALPLQIGLFMKGDIPSVGLFREFEDFLATSSLPFCRLSARLGKEVAGY